MLALRLAVFATASIGLILVLTHAATAVGEELAALSPPQLNVLLCTFMSWHIVVDFLLILVLLPPAVSELTQLIRP